jgi:uncharacterized protein (TIGR02118 family)
MHKLVILVELPPDDTSFDETWPQFLRLSEQMPGLIREATCRVEYILYGDYEPVLLHELFFDSVDAIQQAMSSPEGQGAGEILQRMSGGRLTLLVADHKEDDLENIRKYRDQPDNENRE